MRKEEMREFGEALARYRDEAGLNQRQLAAAISLDATQVNKIERGHRPPLGAKYMEPLVRVLRLSRSEALDLVQKADLSPKVLDFMDGVQAPVHPRILRKKAAQSVAQPQLTSPHTKPQVSSTPLHSMVHPAVGISDSLGVTGEMVEYLIASAHLSEEEEKHIAGEVIEFTKRLLALRETLRKREDG